MNLDFLASIDLISRVHGLIRTVEFSTIRKRRRHHRKTDTPRGAADINFYMPPGAAPIDAERMLRGYGVPVWDRRLCGKEKLPDGRIINHVAMKVPASQARLARYLMMRYGCGVDGAQAAPAAAVDGMPRPWSEGPRESRSSARSSSAAGRALRKLW
jgi:hypothetical protein